MKEESARPAEGRGDPAAQRGSVLDASGRSATTPGPVDGKDPGTADKDRLLALLASRADQAWRAVEDRERSLTTLREIAERDRAELVRANQALALREVELGRLRRELDELRRKWSRSFVRSISEFPLRLAHTGFVLFQMLRWAATLQLRSGLRRHRYARLIRRSQLFDEAFYVAQLDSPGRAGWDPLDHYLREGSAAGLAPNACFDPAWYRERNPEVAASGKDPLVHYIRYGAAEERATSRRFDTAYYLSRHPEVRESTLNPLAHFLLYGAPAGLHGVPPCASLLEPGEGYGSPGEARGALVIDQRILTPREDSGSVRMMAIVRLLREMGMPVTFAADLETRSEADERDLLHLGVQLLLGKRAITEHLRSHGPDYRVVVLSRPDVADRYLALVRAHALWARVVFDTVDLHWLRMARAAAVTGDPATAAEAARLERLEKLLASTADLVLTVTPREREMLREAVPGARVEVVPNIHSVRSDTPPWGARRDLMFIGGFEHAPNVDAVEWFVGEILPLVLRELPEVVFRVVGSKAPERIRRLEAPAVRVLGWVPEVAPVFETSRVFVAPLRFGAGMLGKIGQSIEHGLPVVTTPLGADGVGLVDGESALVASAPEAFAAAVVRLYRDEQLWSRLAASAARLLQESFSEAVIGERLRTLLVAPAPAVLDGPGADGRTS